MKVAKDILTHYKQFTLQEINTGITNAEYAVRGLLPQTASIIQECKTNIKK